MFRIKIAVVTGDIHRTETTGIQSISPKSTYGLGRTKCTIMSKLFLVRDAITFKLICNSFAPHTLTGKEKIASMTKEGVSV